MTNNFFPEVQNPTVGLRFWCYVQGIPYIFVDGALPVARTGTNFPTVGQGFNLKMPGIYAPQSLFAVKENTLDLSRGLESVGADISRRTGVTSPGQMRLTLRDDGSDFLTELFAPALTTATTTEINANFTRTDTTLYVDNHDDFAASGTLYIGKETVTYSAKAGVSGTNARFTGLGRVQCALSGNDVFYDHEDFAASSPRTISDNPRSWAGRYVRVFALIVDEFGRAINTDWGNAEGYQTEIFRGILNHAPRPTDDWTRWTLNARGLESLLDTETGGDYPEGQLINIPGNKSMNQAGQMDPAGEMKGVFDPTNPTVLILDAANKVHMQIQEYATAADMFGAAGPSSTFDYTGDNAATVAGMFDLSDLDPDLVGSISSWGQIYQDIAGSINGLFATAGIDDVVHATIDSGGADGPWGVKLIVFQGSGTKAYKIQFYWDQPDSVSQNVGVTKNAEAKLTQAGGLWNETILQVDDPSSTKNVVGIISEHATQLIYWLKPQTAGATPAAPAATNGFALLGDKEIIKYEDDVDIESAVVGDAVYWQGMRVLKGCTRGMFGTPKTRHVLEIDDAQKATADTMALKFGLGAEDASWPTTFLEIATSTGTTSHNGAYDIRDDMDGSALSVKHFDLGSFQEYDESESDALDKAINFFTADAFNLKGWIEAFLKPRMTFIAATNAGSFDYEYLLKLIRIRAPLESESVQSFTADDVDFDDPATFLAGNNRVVNRIRCNYRWNFAENKADDDQVIATDWDSVQDHNAVKSVSWNLRGQMWTYGQAFARVSMWALRAFQRWGQDFDVVSIKTNRKGLRVSPGDTVSLTLPGMPTKTGVRGFDGVFAVCIRADHMWHDPNGAPASTLVLVVEQQQRNSTYCPTARALSETTIDGDPAVLVSDHEFSPADGDKDSRHFEAGDLVAVYNPGDYASRDLRTIDRIEEDTGGGADDDALVLDLALVNADITKTTYVVAQQYDVATSDQKKHVFISDDGSVLSVANTESFKYT